MELYNTRTINELVSAIAYVLDVMSDDTNLYHSWRTAILASEFAKEILPEERKSVFYAALLHDIGYLALPNQIKDYLCIEEDVVRNPLILSHPIIGAEIVSQIPNLSTPARYILNHHEWYNGRGYPLGRQHDEIPKGAQILLLSDQLDLLMRNKSFRALDEIKKRMASWSGVKVSSAFIEKALLILSQENFIEDITTSSAIPDLFNRERQETGQIDIPSNADAVGITCEIFSLLIDIKHPSMIGHSKRVSLYSLLIGLAMNMEHDDITKIKWAGLLHDVGKLGITRNILNKPRRLSPAETAVIRKHSLLTRKLIETITDFKDIAVIAGSDHERYDGSGYPLGLKGNEIPLPSRIISVADAFDAMTSNRPYKKAVSNEQACKELEKNAGRQFDPAVVQQALPILRNLATPSLINKIKLMTH